MTGKEIVDFCMGTVVVGFAIVFWAYIIGAAFFGIRWIRNQWPKK